MVWHLTQLKRNTHCTAPAAPNTENCYFVREKTELKIRIKKHTWNGVHETHWINETKTHYNTGSMFACSFIAENRNKIIESHKSGTRDLKRDVYTQLTITSLLMVYVCVCLCIEHTFFWVLMWISYEYVVDSTAAVVTRAWMSVWVFKMCMY